MTAWGVIPPPEERKRPGETGRMTDIDGVPVIFSVGKDGTARIEITAWMSLNGHGGTADLDVAKADEFTRLWFETLRQAGAQAAAEDEVVDATIHAADCTGPGCEGECDG